MKPLEVNAISTEINQGSDQ